MYYIDKKEVINMEIRIIKEDKYYKQIIEELRKEYAINQI